MIFRRHFMLQVSGLAFLSPLSTGFANREKSTKPNIVLILVDDLGYGDLGCYGNQDIKTPVIDKLADEGVRFTSFYANAPECTPTRTALLTGRYQQRVGGLECAIGIGNVGRYDDAIRLRQTHDLGLPVEEISIARMLKNTGYNTAVCGKWHLGYEPKFSPNQHGFDYAFYSIGGGMDYFHHVEPPPSKMPGLYLNEKLIKRRGYFTDLVTTESIRFIEKQNFDSRFFLYIPFTAPHSPYQGPDDEKPKPLPDDSALWKQSKGPKDIYYAMIMHIDSCIDKILKKLSEKKLSENTLVIFMSDNGAARSGSNKPFFGFKGSLFEGGIRVPCIAKWPGVLPETSVSNQSCITMDFTVSIAGMAGATSSPKRGFDGIDILDMIKTKHSLKKRTLFWRKRRKQNTIKAVRDGSMKYIFDKNKDVIHEYLFNLNKDPVEENNLLNENPLETERLKELLKEWEKKVKHHR